MKKIFISLLPVLLFSTQACAGERDEKVTETTSKTYKEQTTSTSSDFDQQTAVDQTPTVQPSDLGQKTTGPSIAPEQPERAAQDPSQPTTSAAPPASATSQPASMSGHTMKQHSKHHESMMKEHSKHHGKHPRSSQWYGSVNRVDEPVGTSQGPNEFGDTKNYEGAEAFRNSMGADAVTVVNFDRGSSHLSDQEITSLDQVVNQYKQAGIPIEEVRVFVWPENGAVITQGKRPDRSERKIASERVKQIKRRIQKDLGVRDVKTFNVAQYGHQFQNMVMSPGTTIRSLALDSPLPRQVSLTERINDLIQNNPGQALVLIYKQQ
jgi:hypothetical protein